MNEGPALNYTLKSLDYDFGSRISSDNLETILERTVMLECFPKVSEENAPWFLVRNLSKEVLRRRNSRSDRLTLLWGVLVGFWLAFTLAILMRP